MSSSIQLPTELEQAIRGHRAENGHTDRIIEAYHASLVYAAQLEDPEYAQAVNDKLTRSAVHGSRVDGVRTKDDVLDMLSTVQGWQEVRAGLEDNVTCLQGELPEDSHWTAYAAYSTVREIAHLFGPQGLQSIQIKKGRQRPDEFYACTMMNVPTNIITVQLRTDNSGLESVKQWFAGREKSSILFNDDGDLLVRCSTKIPTVVGQSKGGYNKGPRPHFERRAA